MFLYLIKTLLPLILVVIVGMIGYQVIEGWHWFDALYMTIISLTTVGFAETHRLGIPGRVFTLVLIIIGMGNVAYVIRSLSLEFLSPLFGSVFKEKKDKKLLKRMKDHYIICGYGRIGKDVSFNLIEDGKKVVVIDKLPSDEIQLASKKILYVSGDASQEESLIEAGIARAKGLVSCAKSEAVNVFITLTARELNKDLFIISRYEEEETQKKLKRAGADKFINPYHIGSEKISQLILKPTISKILDFASEKGQFNLNIDELELEGGNELVGKTVKDCRIRDEFNIIIIAVENANGNIVTTPGPNYQFQHGDRLVMIANDKELHSVMGKYKKMP